MNLGINTWVWIAPLTTADLETIVPDAMQLGFNWIELPIEDTATIDYARAAAILRDKGLGVSVYAAMGPDRDLISPDTPTRDNGMAYLRHCIDALHTLSGTNLAVPLCSSVRCVWQATVDERGMQLLVTQLGSLSTYAAERNVVLCIEPVNRFETSYISLATQAIEVIDRVNHPACQMMLDICPMNFEDRSIGEAILMTGHRLKYVHACTNERGAPESGYPPDVADALRTIGYDGPVVMMARW